jgi:hypothetical protein
VALKSLLLENISLHAFIFVLVVFHKIKILKNNFLTNFDQGLIKIEFILNENQKMKKN